MWRVLVPAGQGGNIPPTRADGKATSCFYRPTSCSYGEREVYRTLMAIAEERKTITDADLVTS
jgi:hypothetical protein